MGVGATKRYDLAIFDLDGVIWRDYQEVPGAGEVIERLRSGGIRIAFLTNTSARSIDFLRQKLKAIGIGCHPDAIFTSGRILAELIASEPHLPTLVYGKYGTLRRSIENAGLETYDLMDPALEKLSVATTFTLALGYGEDFGFDHVNRILQIRDRIGGLFAAERDPWYGAVGGVLPGSGWIIGAVEGLLSRPAVVAGKPAANAVRVVLRDCVGEPARTLLVGDSVASDVSAAHNSGIDVCLYVDPEIGVPADTAADPTYIVQSLDQVCDIVLGGAPTR